MRCWNCGSNEIDVDKILAKAVCVDCDYEWGIGEGNPHPNCSHEKASPVLKDGWRTCFKCGMKFKQFKLDKEKKISKDEKGDD